MSATCGYHATKCSVHHSDMWMRGGFFTFHVLRTHRFRTRATFGTRCCHEYLWAKPSPTHVTYAGLVQEQLTSPIVSLNKGVCLGFGRPVDAHRMRQCFGVPPIIPGGGRDLRVPEMWHASDAILRGRHVYNISFQPTKKEERGNGAPPREEPKCRCVRVAVRPDGPHAVLPRP